MFAKAGAFIIDADRLAREVVEKGHPCLAALADHFGQDILKADGTLDRLVENELQAYIESDPEPVVLPKFGFGRTIKIGVTGDLPPMDHVAANGKPAGFNMALLAEIASRAQVNIEVVHIETGARPMALSSGKVDAVFWTKSITCPVCKSQIRERFTDAITTESYFSDVSALVMPKPGK